MRGVYLESETAVGMPTHCQVLGISPLLRELLIETVDLPSEYDANGRAGMIMSLAIEEIRVAPELPLSLPLLTDEKLAARCRSLVPRSRGQSPHFYAMVPARNRTQLFRLATARLFCVNTSQAVARRACHDARL